MAWTGELEGTRRVENMRPSHIDYIITFTGPADEPPPASGSVINQVIAGADPLSDTDLDAEPSAIQISQVTRQTTNKSWVTIRFRSYYVVS